MFVQHRLAFGLLGAIGAAVVALGATASPSYPARQASGAGFSGLPSVMLDAGAINSTSAWASSCSGFFLTTDSGERWSQITPKLLKSSACPNDHGGPIVAVGSDLLMPIGNIPGLACTSTPCSSAERGGGLYFSSDEGVRWKLIFPPGCPASCSDQELSMVTAKIGFDLIGDSLLKTTDGGISWSRVGSTMFSGPVSFSSATSGYEVTESGTLLGGELFVTDTGGSGWTVDSKGAGWRQVSLPATGPYAGIAVRYGLPMFFGSDGVLVATFATPRTDRSPFVAYSTTNGGRSWSARSLPKTVLLGAPDFQFSALDRRHWFVVDGTSLYSTSTAGAAWTRVTPKHGWRAGTVATIAFSSTSTGYAIFPPDARDEPALEMTHDGGANWTELG